MRPGVETGERAPPPFARRPVLLSCFHSGSPLRRTDPSVSPRRSAAEFFTKTSSRSQSSASSTARPRWLSSSRPSSSARPAPVRLFPSCSSPGARATPFPPSTCSRALCCSVRHCTSPAVPQAAAVTLSSHPAARAACPKIPVVLPRPRRALPRPAHCSSRSSRSAVPVLPSCVARASAHHSAPGPRTSPYGVMWAGCRENALPCAPTRPRRLAPRPRPVALRELTFCCSCAAQLCRSSQCAPLCSWAPHVPLRSHVGRPPRRLTPKHPSSSLPLCSPVSSPYAAPPLLSH